MTNEIKATSQNELSADINVITAEINAYQRVAGEAIFEIGRRLKHVKENDLAHGEFGKWLESVGINQRTAQRFIQVYSRFSEIPGAEEASISQLTELLALPEDYEYTRIIKEVKCESVRTIRSKVKGITSTDELTDARKKLVRREQPKVKRELIRSGVDECSVCGFDCKAVLHLHHIVPVGNGGDNSPENLSILCPNCHAMVHSFLTDSAEREYGLDYLVDWMNENLSLEGIEVVRELWGQMNRKDVS